MSSANTQFSVAVHILSGIGANAHKEVTSATLAQTVNACPSFVRRVLSKLSKAGLVKTTTGKFGFCALGKDPKEISLLEVFEAVEAPKAFAIHTYEEQKSCKISCGIKKSMEKVLDKVQDSVSLKLGSMTLSDVLSDLKRQ